MLKDFKINGNDYSDIFQYSTTSEALRKVYGSNGVVTLSGEEIVDLIAVKHDLATTIVPMRPSRLTQLMNEIEGAYCSVTYFSGIDNALVTRTMIIEPSEVAMLIQGGTRNDYIDNIYGNMTLTIKEK